MSFISGTTVSLLEYELENGTEKQRPTSEVTTVRFLTLPSLITD